MGHPRRGYVLIGVLAALSICTAVVGSYALASRRAAAQTRAEIDRARAEFAARGAAVQAMKELSVRLGAAPRGDLTGVLLPGGGGKGVVVQGLPEFPAELAGAGGLLGEIARKMEEIRRRQADADRAKPDPAKAEAERLRAATEPPPMPLGPVGNAAVVFDGMSIPVVFECETGKLNINQTARSRLEGLLSVLKVPDDRAAQLLNALEDYRIDRLPPDAAAKRFTRQRLRDRSLTGRPLIRLEELLEVPGFTADLYERLLPHVTVYGGSVVDPNYATREVFMALGVREDGPLRSLADAQRRSERIEKKRLRDIVGDAAFSLMEDAIAYRLRPVFTVRANASINKAIGRYMLRMDFNVESGLPQVVESREGWL